MADATLFADGFEEAVIGVDNTTHNSIPRVVYSKAKMVKVLVTSERWTVEEALEETRELSLIHISEPTRPY